MEEDTLFLSYLRNFKILYFSKFKILFMMFFFPSLIHLSHLWCLTICVTNNITLTNLLPYRIGVDMTQHQHLYRMCPIWQNIFRYGKDRKEERKRRNTEFFWTSLVVQEKVNKKKMTWNSLTHSFNGGRQRAIDFGLSHWGRTRLHLSSSSFFYFLSFFSFFF